MFEGGRGDWKKKHETWLNNRKGEINAYGGDSGSPLLAKVMSGVLPTTDLSADLVKWAESVPPELQDAAKYNNDNHVLFFAHWEGTRMEYNRWTWQRL